MQSRYDPANVERLLALETAPCDRCNGTGRSKAYKDIIPEGECHCCNGRGTFHRPQIGRLVDRLLINRKGGRRFRSSRPDIRDRSVDGLRVYFLWRLARFHGGRDVTMPMGAEMDVSGDPYEPLLMLASEQLAARVFGSDMAAAHRWAGALGFDSGPVPPGLPASAYPGGPVADEHKPTDEALELMSESEARQARLL